MVVRLVEIVIWPGDGVSNAIISPEAKFPEGFVPDNSVHL